MQNANRPLLSSAPSNGRLVLLVEDSRAQRRVIATQLVRAGFRIAEATSMAEAMAFCAHSRPDVIISDWDLPGQSGLDLCRAFRRETAEGYVYFILLTSKPRAEHIAEGLEAGADEFLSKPVSAAELRARLCVAERILQMEERLRNANAELSCANFKLSEAQAAMERDLRDAHSLQKRLSSNSSAEYGDFRISLLLRPAGHVGGDLVGYFPINSRRVGLYALDVSGHGVAAALLTARLAAQLSSLGDQNIALRMTDLGLYDARSPVDLMQTLNQQMLNELRIESYYTMAYADLDHLNGDIRLVQAGHPHPLLQRLNGEIERIGHGGLPVGVMQNATFEEIRLNLGPGDRLFIASDGITECENQAGIPLGEDGLRAILRTNQTLHGEAFIESLSWSLETYRNGPRTDDVSAVLIERQQ